MVDSQLSSTKLGCTRKRLMEFNKLAIAGAKGTFFAGLLLHVAIPGLVGGGLVAIASVLTLLDPLYAGDRIESMSSTLGVVLVVQLLHASITATAVGGSIGYIASRLRSFWLYPIGFLLSTVLHGFFFFLFAAGLSMMFAEKQYGQLIGISLAITILVGPILGLVSAFLIRRWGV